MAEWNVSDELDARLRRRLGEGDVSHYVEAIIADQLNYEEDPAYRAHADVQMAASEQDIEAGRLTDARQAMRSIARDKGVNLDR